MEYKFRGKRKDNGGWAYGCYVSTNPDEAFILLGVTGHIKRDDYECYMVEVYPATVSMWTGCYDVKGNMIFPGDIFGNIIQLRCVVRKNKDGEYRLYFVDKRITSISIFDDKVNKSQVQGNIHDNPELLTPADKTAKI